MISIIDFINALKKGQLVYVSISNLFVLLSTTLYFVLANSDYLYEKLYTKFRFDMINVARLIFAAISCLLISLVNAFVISRVVATIISVVLAIIAFILIKNARDLPIWEEKE